MNRLIISDRSIWLQKLEEGNLQYIFVNAIPQETWMLGDTFETL